MSVPNNLKYTAEHIWINIQADGLIQAGITDHAQNELGDLVYVELPEPGRKFHAKEQCGTVESVKTASELFSPVSGEITAINEALADDPGQINATPYQSWLFCMKADELLEIEQLLDADAYQNLIS